MSNWLIVAGALVVLGVAAVIGFVLLRRYGGQGAQIQLDAIRTGGTLVIGTGGAVALLLTARRQRYIELTLEHTEHDATERRITELYTQAAELLGSEQAPVRLAGLYALERLAHTAEHRQTMVNVICAYLRMPYTPPQSPASVLGAYRSPGPARRHRARTLTDRPSHATPKSQEARQEYAQQQKQVRLTAQNILLRNLHVAAQRRRRWWHRTPPPATPAWPGIRLDLTGALLLEFSLAECQLAYADFTRAQFTGADFECAEFTGGADFEGARFTGRADFEGAEFAGRADFEGARFTGGADFWGAQFTGGADFKGAQFADKAFFRGAQFASGVDFEGAQFTDRAHFGGAEFTGWANFESARVTSAAEPLSVWPQGWTTRSAMPDHGEDPAFLYGTEVEEPPDV